MPVSGRGRALYQPIWAEDVADCVIALRAPEEERRTEARREADRSAAEPRARYELAGPETLSHNDIVRVVLRSLNRQRPLVHVPTPIVSRALRLLERVSAASAFATWDEAELMEVPMVSARGAADAERLGRDAAADAGGARNRLRLKAGRSASSARDASADCRLDYSFSGSTVPLLSLSPVSPTVIPYG